MKASLRSVRIAPKKANLIAGMVRGRTVKEALHALEHTNKKAARILEELVKSAAANARNNDNQDPDALVIKSLIVNKAQAYHRGVPMARGRVRPMRKYLSHISLTLGVDYGDAEAPKPAKKEESASKTAKKPVKSAVKSEKSTSKAPAAKDTSPSDSGSTKSDSPKK